MYHELVNDSEGGPRHAVVTPRDPNQIKNFRKPLATETRLSHDSIYNVYQLCYQLKMNNRKGEAKDFIRHVAVYPNIILHLIAQPLLDSLELLLRLPLSHSVMLHYDTVFNIGDFYLSTLLFRQYMFKKHPLVPIGFFIHSRRFHEDHQCFLEVVRRALPTINSKKIVIVTDREFTFSDMFPLGYHLFCWNHLKRDLQFYLRNKANCTPTDVNYFTNAFQDLMTESTETEFDRAWTTLKKEKKFCANHLTLNYFESKLLPAFKMHSSIWVLKSAGVLNPHNGVTNNPSESMNAVLHSLQNWKQVPLDIICTSLYHLCAYYHREIERGLHNCGSWELCDEFSSFSRDPSMMPNLPKTVDPKDIVRRARGECLDIDLQDECENNDEPKVTDHSRKPSAPQSQIGLARDAIHQKRVHLADTGCWLVKGSDGKTPYAVTLYPKETCSCPAVKACYHIMACKLMIGLSVEDITSSNNVGLLHQQIRRKQKEKPSGRKAPRKHDFKMQSEDTDQVAKEIMEGMRFICVL